MRRVAIQPKAWNARPVRCDSQDLEDGITLILMPGRIVLYQQLQDDGSINNIMHFRYDAEEFLTNGNHSNYGCQVNSIHARIPQL